jgi:Right handed beta helix region
MTTPFANPLTGAQGTLVRAQIKSPNFSIADETGWAIMQNGDAYFFNVTATGEIIATILVLQGAGTMLVYEGSPALGTLIYSDSGQGGTDPHGNVYLAGAVSYQPLPSSANALQMTSAGLTYWTAPGSGGPWTQAAIPLALQQGIGGAGTFLSFLGIAYVYPSGDQTGATDTAVLQAALNLVPVVMMLAGEFWLTQVELNSGNKVRGCGWQVGTSPPAADGCTLIKAGSANSATSMFYIPGGTSAWEISGVMLNGQQAGGLKLYTAGIICCPNTGTLDNDYGVIDGVSAELSGGDGVYIGTNRAGVRISRSQFENCAGNGVNLLGSSNTVTFCELNSNATGITMTGELNRLSYCDIYKNTVGTVIGGGRQYCYGNSWDQQAEQALIVSGAFTGITIHGRFTSNCESANNTYYCCDVSAAATATGTGSPGGQGGVTFAPGTMFTEPEFGVTNLPIWNIWTNGNAALVNDYSTWDTSGAVSGHMDSTPWRYVGAAGQPAFAADWGNYGHAAAALAFSADGSQVRINGYVTPSAGAGATLFTLPAGFLPASTQGIVGMNQTTGIPCVWQIGTTGVVAFLSGAAGLVSGDPYVINGSYSLSI